MCEQIKKCYICNLGKPLSHFHKLPISRDGHAYKCADCVSVERLKIYYSPEKVKERETIKEERNKQWEYKKEQARKNRQSVIDKRNKLIASQKARTIENILKRKTRKCNTCSKNKQLSQFNKNSTDIIGLSHTCKSCSSELSYAYHKNTKEKNKEIVIDITKKTCIKCKEELRIIMFEREDIIKGGFRNVCKRCRLKKRKESLNARNKG